MAISMNTGGQNQPQNQPQQGNNTPAQEWLQNAAQQQPIDQAPIGFNKEPVPADHHPQDDSAPWEGDVTAEEMSAAELAEGDLLSDAGLDAPTAAPQTNQQIANQQAEAGDMLAAMAATQTVAIDPGHPEGDKTVTASYQGTGTIEVTNKLEDSQTGEVKMETEQKAQVPVQLDATKPQAKLAFKAGFTKNMGDFNSYRCDVMVELPCAPEDVDATYSNVKGLVENKLQECYNEAEQMAVALQQQIQQQIQAQSDPVSIPPHLQSQQPAQQAADPMNQPVNNQQPYQQPQYQNQAPQQQNQYQPAQQQNQQPQQYQPQQQQFAPQQQQYVDSQTAGGQQQTYQPGFMQQNQNNGQ